MSGMRLQKFLSAAGLCSRRAGERHILAGRVRVNGSVITTLGTRVDPEQDQVKFDGQPVVLERELIYIILNKPSGYVCSCRQPGERLVTRLVDLPQRIFPVGRLDKDSTGLLLLTNDGRVHHRLSHPSFDHAKTYRVTVEHPISNQALSQLARGIMLNGRPTRPARVKRLAKNRFQVVLQEGRNRQIRRIAGAVGAHVVGLHRIRIAHIRLGRLDTGRWRHLDHQEREKLQALLPAAHPVTG